MPTQTWGFRNKVGISTAFISSFIRITAKLILKVKNITRLKKKGNFSLSSLFSQPVPSFSLLDYEI